MDDEYQYIADFIHAEYGNGQWRRITTGFSTVNFEFRNDEVHFIVRYAPDFPVFGVFRENEAHISKLAGFKGISPKLHHFQPLNDGYIFIYDFIADIHHIKKTPENCAKLALVLRRVHHDIIPQNQLHQLRLFNPLNEITNYKNYFVNLDYAKRYEWHKWYEKAIKLNDQYTAPYNILGHHDCLLANFLTNGERIWVIDWEYAGCGTPFFDLASLSVFANCDDSENRIILSAYCDGKINDEIMRNFNIMRYMANLREYFWFLVAKEYIGKPDYDYLAIADDLLVNLIEFDKNCLS